MEQKQPHSQTAEQSVRFALWEGVVANVITILLSIHFYWVPAGEHVHPVLWFLAVFIIAFVTFSLLPFRSPLFKQSRPVFLLWAAFVLGVMPLPLGAAILHHAAWLKGFSIS